jgi:hypothetical protein
MSTSRETPCIREYMYVSPHPRTYPLLAWLVWTWTQQGLYLWDCKEWIMKIDWNNILMSLVAIRPTQQHYFLTFIYFSYTRHVSAIIRRYYKNIKFKVAFYIFVLSPDDPRTYRPKCVAYIRRKWMLEHLCCCIGLIAFEDINSTNTTGWLYSRNCIHLVLFATCKDIVCALYSHTCSM